MKHQETICTVVAADPKAGEFGVACASAGLAVGKNVPFTGAFVGAVAVQGYVSPFFGIAGMKLLREGVSAREIPPRVIADDPLRDSRQIIVVDAAGATGVHCGLSLPSYAGCRQGQNYAVAGCGLAGQAEIDACADAFEKSGGDLASRLMAAIAAFDDAHKAGGLGSAALRISHSDPFPCVDLRIDSHGEPVKQLSRLLDIWRGRTSATAVPDAPQGDNASSA